MRFLLALALLLASGLSPLPRAAEQAENQPPHSVKIGKFRQEISIHEEKLEQQPRSVNIGKLRQEISMHEEKLEQSGKEELSLLSEMERLDEKIAQQKIKIDTLRVRIKEQQLVIDAKEKELATIIQNNKDLQQHLTKRLRAFYLMGKTGFLNIVFSSQTLPQLLLTNDAFHSLITYDQTVFAAYRESVAAIDRVKRSHELEKSVLENFLADADKEGLVLQQTAEEKNSLLKRVQAHRGLYEQALKEMKKAEKTLTSTLTDGSRTREGRRSGDFLRNKGKLPPPVWGEIASLFRQAAAETDDTTFTNGITIHTPDRTEVYAVFDGEVIFSGYMRGYGKMLIIDHDQQYYTVTAGFEELRVKEGALVKQEQVVGLTGKSATLFGRGLYFEIRHGVLAENPLDWLQPGILTAP